MSPQQPLLDPEGLEAYFTDVEHLRDTFKNAVAAQTLTKRLLVIPEGIPLLEAERLARELEPGDGSPQQTVVEKIQAALGSGGNK